MQKLTYKQIGNLLFQVEFDSYDLLSTEELIWLLNSNLKEERAISAKLLGEREAKESVPYILKALKSEHDKNVALIMNEAFMSLSIANK